MLTQPQTPQLFNPDEQKRIAALAQKYQLLEIKFAASKRNVAVYFKDGKNVHHEGVDISRVSESVLTLFTNDNNTVVRYPLSDIVRVDEVLLNS